MEKKKRVKEIDIIRCIAILCVIVGHSSAYQHVNNYENLNYDLMMIENGVPQAMVHMWICRVAETIYLFHMPLFFAVSGATFALALMKKDQNGNFSRYPSIVALVKDKAKRLLIPYVVVNAVWNAPLKYLAGMYAGLGKKQIVKNIIKGQFLLAGNNYLWFVLALFQIFVIVYVLEKYIPERMIKLFLLIMLSLLKTGLNNPLIYTAMDNAIYFYIGYMWYQNREECNQLIEKQKYCIPVSFILLLVAEYMKNIAQLDGFFQFSKYLGISAGVVFTYSVGIWLLRNTTAVDSKFVKIVNDNSFGLYLYTEPLNALIMTVIVSIFSVHALGNEIMAIVIFALRTVGVSMIAVLIVNLLKKAKLKYLY